MGLNSPAFDFVPGDWLASASTYKLARVQLSGFLILLHGLPDPSEFTLLHNGFRLGLYEVLLFGRVVLPLPVADDACGLQSMKRGCHCMRPHQGLREALAVVDDGSDGLPRICEELTPQNGDRQLYYIVCVYI